MFVVISRFTIANDMAEEVRSAFKNRPRLVEQAPGFKGIEVMSPLDDVNEVWLLTRWLDQASFDAWHGSHAYHESHRGMPKGLKLVPGSTQILHFEVFAA